MRKVYWIMMALLVAPLSAAAQNTPAVEVFGGYSHVVGNLSNSTFNLNGFDGSVEENLNKWFGGKLDIASTFGTEAGFKVNSQSIAYGPVFSYRKNPSVRPFVEGLLGAVRGSSEYLGVSQPEWRFGLFGGGGVDVKLNDRISLRVIDVDYVMTRFSSARQDNVRISAGFVFRFGHK
jgi:opacity protein-like surface antigen